MKIIYYLKKEDKHLINRNI